jgi:hypothetical protein
MIHAIKSGHLALGGQTGAARRLLAAARHNRPIDGRPGRRTNTAQAPTSLDALPRSVKAAVSV